MECVRGITVHLGAESGGRRDTERRVKRARASAAHTYLQHGLLCTKGLINTAMYSSRELPTAILLRVKLRIHGLPLDDLRVRACRLEAKLESVSLVLVAP